MERYERLLPQKWIIRNVLVDGTGGIADTTAFVIRTRNYSFISLEG